MRNKTSNDRQQRRATKCGAWFMSRLVVLHPCCWLALLRLPAKQPNPHLALITAVHQAQPPPSCMSPLTSVFPVHRFRLGQNVHVTVTPILFQVVKGSFRYHSDPHPTGSRLFTSDIEALTSWPSSNRVRSDTRLCVNVVNAEDPI